ncbi:MAG: TonB-dependent receptor [Maricaulaceae bacterium]
MSPIKSIALLGTAHAFFLYAPHLSAQTNTSSEDEIIVTGSPLSRSLDEAITGVSVLTGDELQDRLAATIGETLKSEPGLSSTFFGAGASRPIVRGQGGDRVRVLNNGVGSIDASAASPDHAVAAVPAQAERIEVLRGASLLRYGSSGSGGIINVLDGRIPDSVPEDGLDGAVRFGASSVDTGQEAAASLDWGVTDNIVVHLDATRRDSSDFRIPGNPESEIQLLSEGEDPDEDDDRQRLDNSFAESDSYTGGISYVGERGFFGVAVHQFNSTYGLPGGHEEEEGEEEGGEEGEEEEGEEEVFIDQDQFRVDVNGALELDGFFEKVQVFGGYADYEHIEFEGPGEVGTVFTNEGGEVRIEAIQRENNGWQAAYGVQYRTRDFSAIGEEAFVEPSTTDQYGIYTFQQIDFGQAHIEGAVRYEVTDHENDVTGVERDFDLISASVGGDYHFTENVRLGGTVFRTERAPTTEELFSNGPHLATSQFEIGDVDLDKEVATGVEAALRVNYGEARLTLNAFYTDYEDYIFEVQTGEIEDGLDVFQFVGDDAEFSGFEVAASSPVATFGNAAVSWDGLVEYVSAETDSGDLPRIPPLSVLTGFDVDVDRLSFRGEVEYTAEQNDITEFELPTDDFTFVNLFATWNLPIEAQDVKASVSVQNLFDTDGRQHASFLKDTVPLPGRNFRFNIRAAF